jgi:hypothetical protein
MYSSLGFAGTILVENYSHLKKSVPRNVVFLPHGFYTVVCGAWTFCGHFAKTYIQG